ncbi:YlcI/YnfO family protein [Rhodoplanes elegans]|uniref:YlcI/YnfO family protein n=1 Tax=Rhodoplanes elegans TaxID=29408 RepID=UPI0011B93AFE|nr:YlcI/YnfO family protein [Rhodoplanes elegans]
MTSTENLVCDTPRRVGRKKRWAEDMQARFPEGTFDRIAAVLSDGEDRTDFVRDAVDRELARRERMKARQAERDGGE